MQTVCAWRKRIAQHGAQGLREGERCCRPLPITQETRLQLIALACEPHEPEGRVTPTLDEIVTRAIERGIVEKISRSHVQLILQLATFDRIGSGNGYTVLTRPFARRSM